MNLVTPTTQEISDNIVAQLSGSIGQSIPLLPKTFTRVLAKVIAGVFVMLYKYAGFAALQMFVTRASASETIFNGQAIVPLVEWGRLVGVGDPEPATAAELIVDVTVLTQTGVLPANSQLVRAQTGVVYLTNASVALDAPVIQVRARAASDQAGGGGLGIIGNLSPGDQVGFASPLPNVATLATVSSQSVTGADAETSEAYRARILRRFQRRPQGGAYADYQAWGEEAAGIVAVYPYTGAPGQVDVYAEATPESSGSPDGYPTPAQLAAVAALIEQDQGGLASRRPANAAVNVYSITRASFTAVVTGLAAPNIPDAQNAIEDALDDYMRTRAPFIEGLSTLPRLDRVTEAAAAGVVDDVVSAIGGSVTSVSLELSGVPQPSYTVGRGEKARLANTVFN